MMGFVISSNRRSVNKMRLIDELTLQRELFCRIQGNAVDSGSVHYDSYKNWCLSGSEVEKAISDIFSQVDPFCPTIDPEALPIVRELRAELERVTAERDALAANSRPAVHGAWKTKKIMIRTPAAKNYVCSVCGEDGFNTNFCPHCGADMRGKHDATP